MTSESFHIGGCIRYDHAAGEGQSRYNNDYGWDHNKERERQSLVHNYKIKAKYYEIAKAKHQTEKYCDAANSANAKVREFEMKNRV